jgi:hypothetical protein
MLKAGSLYFSLFISFVVTLLLGSLILFAYYSNSYASIQTIKDQVEANAGSGITLALYDTTLIKPGCEGTFSLYDEEDTIDDVILSKAYWGVYQIIKSTARWKNFEITKIAFTGTDLTTKEPIAIYMADKGRYLSFSGKTDITGNCYFPKLGVRRAYIEGQSFAFDRLVKGEIKQSNPELPALQNTVLNAGKVYLSDSLFVNDSLITPNELTGIDSLKQSFNKRTLAIYSPNTIVLDKLTLNGNIRVISSKSITVTRNFISENILLYAPKVYFEEGFSGSIQAFAQDTLVADENCNFIYPSCLGLINDNINGIYLEIKDKTNLAGSILLYQENKATNTPYLKLGKQTIIHGQVYCPGIIEIKGTVKGSLYCNMFALKTFSAYYENHLMNVTVDRSALSVYYSGSFLLPVYKYANIIQWLD